MNRRKSIFFGLALIIIGILALLGNAALSIFGLSFRWWQVWRLWPLIVLAVGGLLVLPILTMREKRGLGALFIPALPILVTGGILFYASMFDAWGIWAYLWPLEVIGLAAGFIAAAIYGRLPWLAFPGVIIGLNGLAFLFSSLTGFWGAWSVLWAIEPLSLGLAFAAMGALQRSRNLVVLGLSFCAFAAVAFTGMSMLMLTGGWIFRLLGPALLIGIGLLLLGLGFVRRPESTSPAAETSNA